MTEPVRWWAYPALTLAVGLLVYFGYVSIDDVARYVAVVGALLTAGGGIFGVEKARSNVTPVVETASGAYLTTTTGADVIGNTPMPDPGPGMMEPA